MQAAPDASDTIEFSKHAATRLDERSGLDLDQARGEIAEAIVNRRVEWRARNIWLVSTRHGERSYPVAKLPGRLVVLTVIAAVVAAVAA